jgi:hypothetical protein
MRVITSQLESTLRESAALCSSTVDYRIERQPRRQRRITARHRRVTLGTLALVAYDTFVRPWMLNWGSAPGERDQALPGDDIVEPVMSHYTRAVTINAPPEAVWPWLVQIGDHRAGFYSYDWIERFAFPGTVHYIERTHSATRIHAELQNPQVGDRINTGSVGRFAIGQPITILEPNRALVVGTWAFILQPLPANRTRLLVRERDSGWIRLLAPRRFGLLRAAGSLIDYVIAEPLHFAMTRKMMLGLKQRAETLPPR